ncbi:MAG: hypothetical protein M3Y87_18640 [Myxococcota bacterium]|nr:hypothetical protein [Myxococcota bacterium]
MLGELASQRCDDDELVFVRLAEPQRIRRESRVFLCDGRAVASSRYRVELRLSPDADTPLEGVSLATARWVDRRAA